MLKKNEKEIFEQEYSLYIDRVDIKRKSFNACAYILFGLLR